MTQHTNSRGEPLLLYIKQDLPFQYKQKKTTHKRKTGHADSTTNKHVQLRKSRRKLLPSPSNDDWYKHKLPKPTSTRQIVVAEESKTTSSLLFIRLNCFPKEPIKRETNICVFSFLLWFRTNDRKNKKNRKVGKYTGKREICTQDLTKIDWNKGKKL